MGNYDKKMDKVTKALEITGFNISEGTALNRSLELRPFTQTKENEFSKYKSISKNCSLFSIVGNIKEAKAQTTWNSINIRKN